MEAAPVTDTLNGEKEEKLTDTKANEVKQLHEVGRYVKLELYSGESLFKKCECCPHCGKFWVEHCGVTYRIDD